MNTIGLRKEEKAFESRVALVPKDVIMLHKQHGIKFIIEPSDQRAFSEDEYSEANPDVKPLKGSEASVILGIKEMPIDFFEESKVYIFFSHTVKGQSYNMPMLRRIMEVGATLIDYERIVDDNGRRLVYFGNWAGLAGMSDTLRSFGELIEAENLTPNPFKELKPTLEMADLEELRNEFAALSNRIASEGIPSELSPLVVGFAGYGNVSKGAQSLFDILPHETVLPDELGNLPDRKDILYKCIFKEEDMVRPVEPNAQFDLQDYYNHGISKYEGIFEQYIPHLTILMNCIYWTEKYPRLVTKEYIRNHWNEENRRLRVIGDISCDVEGAIEITVQTTKPDNPSFTYIIDEDKAELGVSTKGPVVMAVDNLPCELPRESSSSFSSTIFDFIPILAKTNFDVPFPNLVLPRELRDAVIVHKGELTPKYKFLEEFLSKQGESQK